MIELGESATLRRVSLRDAALEAATQAKEDDVDAHTQYVARLAKRIHRGYFSQRSRSEESGRVQSRRDVPVPCKRRKKRRGNLTYEEKHEIVYKVQVEFQKHEDVAKELGVSKGTITQLVCKAKKRPKLLEDLTATHVDKVRLDDIITSVVTRLNTIDAFIDSAEVVVKTIKEETGLEVSQQKVRLILKHMGMKYRKVKYIPIAGNSDRSLVLRQQWSIAFLRLA